MAASEIFVSPGNQREMSQHNQRRGLKVGRMILEKASRLFSIIPRSSVYGYSKINQLVYSLTPSLMCLPFGPKKQKPKETWKSFLTYLPTFGLHLQKQYPVLLKHKCFSCIGTTTCTQEPNPNLGQLIYHHPLTPFNWRNKIIPACFPVSRALQREM